ncbi:MAG: hypothetical protein N4A71_26285 [Carboxylicivirga sp.]|jgi:hypothetical protein|nr:hypothetical protein [Carboxylicivirga sp.]
MKTYLLAIIALLGLFTACEPRIDFDDGQWGDHAYIDKVHIFSLLEEKHELSEWHTDSVLVTGVRRQIESLKTDIDSIKAIATVTIKPNVDLKKVGIIFSHRSKKIEPLQGSPVAGLLGDFSDEKGPFLYRLFSADGTKRDWTVIIKEEE